MYLSLYSKYGPSMSLDEYAERVWGYIAVLRNLSSDFQCLAILDGFNYKEISNDTTNFYNLIHDSIEDIENVDQIESEQKIHSRSGFHTAYFVYDHDQQTTINSKSGIKSFSVNAGALNAQFSGSSIKFNLVKELGVRQFSLLKSIFTQTVDYWNCKQGCITSNEFRKAYTREQWSASDKDESSFEIKGRYEGHINIGWVTYVNFPPLPSLLPSDIYFEVLEDGGTLIYTSKEEYADETQDQIMQAQYIHRVLEALHLQQSEYALEGWPPDKAEWDYEYQITGAPDGRKYLVKFCYFDGYDASRDVLLYAKLFRIMGVPENPRPNNLYCKAYLAEARRQLAAVDAAGATTPIEWHIGIQENATALQKLFALYEDISDSRLRVIFTPYEGDLD